MEIERNGAQPSSLGPAADFTGHARRDPLYAAPAPGLARRRQRHLRRRRRTVWHTHPLGQLLIITSGSGRVQAWGGPVEEVRAGDVVWFAPGEKHWHGAGATTGMSHIAVVEAKGGSTTDWLEPVTEAQFGG